MPLFYPSRPQRPLSDPLAVATLTDADDSIVLSDLVRSGEASRLRRRGAIAIRDSSSGSASMNNPAPTPLSRALPSQSHRAPPLVVLPTPDDYPDEYEFDDGEDDDDDDFVGVWSWGRRSVDSVELLERDSRRISLEAEMHLEETDQSAGVYALFCGGFDHAEADSHATETPDPPPRRRASAFCPASPPPRPSPPRTNGCGAIIHLNAIPRRQHGVWIARGAATDSVVGLDASYFDGRAVAKMMKNSCGCVRKGVGCRVCGNPLGTIYVPCKTAVDGIFATPSPSPTPPPPTMSRGPSSTAPPRQPSGPSYWLPRSQPPRTRPRSQSQPPPPHAVFTFFASNVRPSPSFTFPPPAPPPHHAHPPSPQPDSPSVPQRRWPEYPITRQSVVWGESEVYGSEERARNRDGVIDEDGGEAGVMEEGEVEGAEKVETAATVWADR
ncbi:hypothetical protein OF83DRAFT_1083266 [Amylostereum chailletii]|nr:hypothetical protein OF83DRAFT_1083266 [Amylostereum chailletii]